jgi:threonine/homoserine/homoserine lactone efflux protein
VILDYIDLAPVPAFLVAVFVICITPGPDMAYVVGAGLAGGPSAATRAAFGITLGVTVYVAATAFGLSIALSAFPSALAVVQLIGAGYLGWMAWTTFRSSQGETSPSRVGTGAWFRRGFVVNLTNPKIMVFFIAFLPQFVGDARSSILQLVTLGLLLQFVGLVIDLAFGWGAGIMRSKVLDRPARLRSINLVSATVFAVLACVVVVDSAMTII